MIITYITRILNQLDSIEKKVDGKDSKRFLDINQVAQLTSLSQSTIRRAIRKGELKCSKKLGKLLFKVEWVDRWLNG
jgi:excisionase family DNA binding protein|tara:strand:- start:78 stop:308 length:231 start_codon:yes stop_codon:yes gene_type:complete